MSVLLGGALFVLCSLAMLALVLLFSCKSHEAIFFDSGGVTVEGIEFGIIKMRIQFHDGRGVKVALCLYDHIICEETQKKLLRDRVLIRVDLADEVIVVKSYTGQVEGTAYLKAIRAHFAHRKRMERYLGLPRCA